MRTYHAFFNGKCIEVQAESLYAAFKLAVTKLNVRPTQRGKLAVILVDVPVSTSSLG